MVGNDQKMDIAGANRQGLLSIWPNRFHGNFHSVKEADWQPDDMVHISEEKLNNSE